MPLLRASTVRLHELTAVLACLPASELGLDAASVLALWQGWHRQGALFVGAVYDIAEQAAPVLQSLGVTLWLTDSGAQALTQAPQDGVVLDLYQAECAAGKAAADSRVMNAQQICSAHADGGLNLLILHFWFRGSTQDPGFHPVFIHASTQFYQEHQGFGMQRLFQEVVATDRAMLESAGFRVLKLAPREPANPAPQRLLMGLDAADARAAPGSTMSFLFLSPPSRLGLRPNVQRVVLLALRGRTDDDIATELGFGRDYVRKLWTETYAALEAAGALQLAANRDAETGRGRERRRQASAFLRENPQELRPGLPL